MSDSKMSHFRDPFTGFVLFVACCSSAGCSTGAAPSAHAGRTDPVVVKESVRPSSESAAFESLEPAAIEPAAHEPTPAAPATEDGAARLVYSHVNAVVRGASATVHVVDVVSNDGPAALDFAYTFPLPGTATVSEFAYFSGGQRIVASAREKSQAKAEFEQAKARGDKAALSENTGNSQFRVGLSPLAPGEARRVELSYVQSVESFGTERSFTFPAAHSAHRGEPTLDLELDVEADSAISNVASLNHPDARLVALDGRTERVLVNRTATALGQDLVIRWTEHAEPLELALRAAAGKTSEPGFAELNFSFNQDTLPAEAAARDFVFAVDTSLSMAGDALSDAKLLVERAVEHVTPRDRLALIEFDDQLASFGELLPATTATKERLLSELRAKHASGLSNVEAAIDRAHELLAHSPNPNFVLISDGQSTVGEHPDELAPAATASDFDAVRVFIALVNYPGQQPQFERLFPHATLRFLPNGEAGRERARALAELLAAPVLENVRIEINGLSDTERYGDLPSRLALGERIRLLGRTSGADVSATVRATLHGHELHFEQKAVLSPLEQERDSVSREWARSKLHALESRYRTVQDPSIEAEAVALGKEFGLVSSFTSLVASDAVSPDRIAPGDPELRIRAPRNVEAVSAVLPWGEEVQCSWQENEKLWLGRFLVPRTVSDGLYRVAIFMRRQGRVERRSTLLLRVDSQAPHFALRLQSGPLGTSLVASPEANVFDRSGDALRLDLVDVKRISLELDGVTRPLTRGSAGEWQIPLPSLADGVHRVSLVATDYAQNSARSVERLRVTHGGREVRVLERPRATIAEYAPPASLHAPELTASSTHVDVRCWFGSSTRRAALTLGTTRLELFDEFLRIDGHEFSPCNGLPAPHPVAIAARGDDFLLAFRDGTRSLYRNGAFEPAEELTPAEESALKPATAPLTSRISAGELPSGNISALVASGSHLVVGTFDQGLFTIDPSGQIAALPAAPRFVNALFSEPDSIWVASATGLFQWRQGAFRELPLETAAAHVNDLTRAKDGTLWLATSDGLLGFRAGEWRKLDERAGLPSHLVYAVAESQDGALWAGTAAGVVRIDSAGHQVYSVDTGALPHPWVTALLADEAHGVWVGTYQGGVTHLSDGVSTRLLRTQPLWINPHGLQRSAGRMVLATMGGGLVSLDANPASEAQQLLEIAPLPSRDVTAIATFAGALWVGTRGGLVRLPLASGR